jgi:hypothetical protein
MAVLRTDCPNFINRCISAPMFDGEISSDDKRNLAVTNDFVSKALISSVFKTIKLEFHFENRNCN